MSARRNKGAVSLNYVRILRMFMLSIGAWPAKAVGEKRLFVFTSFYVLFVYMSLDLTAIIGGFLFIGKNIGTLSFYMLGDVYITQFLSFVILMAIKIDIFSYHYTLITSGIMCSGMILFNLTPMYNNYKNGVFTNNKVENYTLQFSVNYILPGFDPKDHFIISTCVNFWMSYSCTIFVCVMELLLCLMVFQIIGHIQVLKYKLEHFPEAKHEKIMAHGNIIDVNMYDEQENKLVHKIISECVDHHLQIVNFTGEMSNFFGLMLAFSYLYDLVCCSVLLVESLQGEPDAIARYGPLTFIIFGQLIQSSVLFEFVTSQSEKLIDAVYSMPWECMNTSNRRSVCILLSRIQTPISVTAMGMVPVGVQTMLAILKTTFSYFAFLQTLG